MKTLLLLLFLMPSLSKSAEISFTCTFYGFIDKLESTEQGIKMYDKPYKKKSINLDTSKKVARTEFYQKKDQKESKVKRLYYFDKDDFYALLKNFKNSLESKGLLYASMMSTSHTYYKFSKKTKFQWLRETNFSGKRFKIKNYHNFHCESEEDVCKKFSIFKKIYCGSYHLQIEKNETNNHHYIILCQKK